MLRCHHLLYPPVLKDPACADHPWSDLNSHKLDQLTKLWSFPKNKCGVTIKTQAKTVAKNIEAETHKTVCELIRDLETSAGLTQTQAIDCVKPLDLKY